MIIAPSHPHLRKEKAEENSLKVDKHNLRLTQQKLNKESSQEAYETESRTTHTTINLSHNLSMITMDFSRRYNDLQQQAQKQIHNSRRFAAEEDDREAEVDEAQIASVDHHSHKNTFRNKLQVWSFGQMFLLFLFIFSLSTSQVTGIPLGLQEDSKNNPHIVTADREYPVVTHLGGASSSSSSSSSLSLHLKPKRSTEDQVIEDVDVGESGGHELFPMYQSHGQLYFPTLLKPKNNGLGIDVTDEISNSNSEESSRPNKNLEKAHEQPFGDRNRYTSYPSSLRQLNKNEILQTVEDIGSNNGGWETVIDPHVYLLTEWNSNGGVQQQRKRRNVGPSLSIVNPLDVLRQRLLLEIARRKMRQTHNNQIIANAEILKNIG